MLVRVRVGGGVGGASTWSYVWVPIGGGAGPAGRCERCKVVQGGGRGAREGRGGQGWGAAAAPWAWVWSAQEVVGVVGFSAPLPPPFEVCPIPAPAASPTTPPPPPTHPPTPAHPPSPPTPPCVRAGTASKPAFNSGNRTGATGPAGLGQAGGVAAAGARTLPAGSTSRAVAQAQRAGSGTAGCMVW